MKFLRNNVMVLAMFGGSEKRSASEKGKAIKTTAFHFILIFLNLVAAKIS
jgi:hypothetical protein